MGDRSVDKMTELAKERFLWSRIENDIRHFINNNCSCVKQKKSNIRKSAPLKAILSAAPMELVSIDFLHLGICTGGYQYLLVIIDNFSCFPQAYPTRKKEDKTASEKLYNGFIIRFGLLGRILHDPTWKER